MKTTELFKTASSKKLNETLSKTFGQKLDLDSLTVEQLEDARNKLRTHLSQVRTNAKFNENLENDAVTKAQWMLDTINAEISNREQVNEFIGPLITGLARVAPVIGRMFAGGAGAAARAAGTAARAAAPAAGAVAKGGAEIAAKNAVPLASGAAIWDAYKSVKDQFFGGNDSAAGEVFKDTNSVIDAVKKYGGQAVQSMSAQLPAIADMAVKYALPIGIVIALLYGGKKLIDKLTDDFQYEMIEDEIGTTKETDMKIRESATDKASAVVTAKTMVDRVGRWIEELAGMENDQLIQLGDTIRDEMGQEQAKAFLSAVAPAIQQALQNLKATRETLATGVRSLTGEEQSAELIGSEPTNAAAGGAEPPEGFGDEEFGAEPDAMNGGMEEPDMGAEDEFGASEPAVGGAEEAGRAKRESVDYSNRLLKVLAG